MEEFRIPESVLQSNVTINKKLHNKFLYDCRKLIIPKLSKTSYKGCSGKICVVGGSEVFSGAPFFAAMSTLKMGADLCFILSDESAASTIKMFSPDLIVYPYIRSNEGYNNKTKCKDKNKIKFILRGLNDCIKDLLKRIDAAVIGPGLGIIDHTTALCLKKIIMKFAKHQIPLIFDAESIQFILKRKKLFDLVKKHTCSFFTPNKKEFVRLLFHFVPNYNVDINSLDIDNIIYTSHMLKKHLGEINIFVKGFHDLYVSKHFIFLSFLEDASFRRVGGLGDILCGVMALFLCWSMKIKPEGVFSSERMTYQSRKYYEALKEFPDIDIIKAQAVFNASLFMKTLWKKACLQNYRGTIASDALNLIPQVFHEMFETDDIVNKKMSWKDINPTDKRTDDRMNG